MVNLLIKVEINYLNLIFKLRNRTLHRKRVIFPKNIEFSDKHPNAIKAIKDVGLFVATVAVAAIKESSRSGSSNSEYEWSDDDRAEYEDSYDDYPADQDTSESSERSSPNEHTVCRG